MLDASSGRRLFRVYSSNCSYAACLGHTTCSTQGWDIDNLRGMSPLCRCLLLSFLLRTCTIKACWLGLMDVWVQDEDEEAQEAVQAGDAQPGDAQPGDAHIENKAEVDSDAGHAFRGTGNSAKAQAEEPPADTSSWEQAEQPPAEEQAEAAPAEDGDGEEQAEQHDVAQLADDGQIVAHPDDAAAARDGGSGSNDESTLRSQYEMMMAALDEPVAEPVAKPDKLHSVGEVYVPPRKYTPPAWQRKPHTVHGVPSPQTDKVP